jgi:hypothetical protein
MIFWGGYIFPAVPLLEIADEGRICNGANQPSGRARAGRSPLLVLCPPLPFGLTNPLFGCCRQVPFALTSPIVSLTSST